MTHRYYPIRCYHSRPEWTWKQWQTGTLHSTKLQHYSSLTIRLFSIISRTLVGGSLTPLQRYIWCILQNPLADLDLRRYKTRHLQTNKMKRSLFQAAVVSILLYGCTTWMLTKRLEKKLDGNYIRMLRAILNKSQRQHPTRHQLYGHRLPITKTIQVRRTRHAGHCWRSRDELISDVLLWTPTYGRAKAGRPAQTYIQ